MPSIILLENEIRDHLRPFSLTRPIADIRTGMYTFRERWEKISGLPVKVSIGNTETHPDDLLILSTTLPPGEWGEMTPDFHNPEQWRGTGTVIDKIWQLMSMNDRVLRQDILLATHNRKSAVLPASVSATNPEQIFFEAGVKAEHCFINASDGPVYVSKGAVIMDGAMLRGPLFIGEGSVIKMGAMVYGATTIGPHCIIGGELKNSIFFGYSNKAHHGYIGDSVIGEWCNLGAGTSNSNIKNTGGRVKVWNMGNEKFEEAGNKCGLFMGDFTRSAINTSFNTGTVTGICANIFNGQQLTPKFIPSFSWGIGNEQSYIWEKAVFEIENWMKFKNKVPDAELKEKLYNIYQNL